MGVFHRLQSLGNAGSGLRGPAASSGSARRENPREPGHLHPSGVWLLPPSQSRRSGCPWERRWERSGKEPKGAAGCLFSRDSRARAPAAPAAMKKPRQDQGPAAAPAAKASPAPAWSSVAAGKGWSGLGAVPRAVPALEAPPASPSIELRDQLSLGNAAMSRDHAPAAVGPVRVLRPHPSVSRDVPCVATSCCKLREFLILDPPVICPLFLVSNKSPFLDNGSDPLRADSVNPASRVVSLGNFPSRKLLWKSISSWSVNLSQMPDSLITTSRASGSSRAPSSRAQQSFPPSLVRTRTHQSQCKIPWRKHPNSRAGSGVGLIVSPSNSGYSTTDSNEYFSRI